MQEIKVAEDSVDCSPSHHVIIRRNIRSDSSSGGIALSQKAERTGYEHSEDHLRI